MAARRMWVVLAMVPALALAAETAVTPADRDGRHDGAAATGSAPKGVDAAGRGDSAPSRRRLSDGGLFEVGFESEVEPIELNRIHRWTLHLATADGAPVENALIAVDGGMPAHDHGLPTAPRVTAELGGGDYLVEGVKFQMPGHWVVTFDIAAAERRDTVTFELMLQSR